MKPPISIALACLFACALAATGLGACGPAATTPPPAVEVGPSPAVEPTATVTETAVSLASPVLEVAKEPLSLKLDAEAEVLELFAGEVFTLTNGSRVTAGKAGVGVVRWGGALGAEMLSEADVTIVDAGTTEASVALSQTQGTARFALPASAGPVAFSVDVGGGRLAAVSDEPLDAIVSFDPAESGSVWVVAVGGPLELAPGEGDAKRVDAGQAVLYSPAMGWSDAMSIDPTMVEVWYGQTASGKRLASASEVAFRCLVLESDTFALSEPGERPGTVLATFAQGDWVTVLGRSTKSDWLMVALTAPAPAGWLPAASVSCPVALGRLPAHASGRVAAAAGTSTLLAPGATPSAALPAASATGAAARSQEDRRRGNGSGSEPSGGGASAPTAAPPTVDPGQPEEPTEDCGTGCANQGEPTETPRPPRRTPTSVPPTSAPPSTEPPPPPPTDEPAPPPPTQEPAPPPEPTSGLAR